MFEGGHLVVGCAYDHNIIIPHRWIIDEVNNEIKKSARRRRAQNFRPLLYDSSEKLAPDVPKNWGVFPQLGRFWSSCIKNVIFHTCGARSHLARPGASPLNLREGLQMCVDLWVNH